jgi:hypothetical protein
VSHVIDFGTLEAAVAIAEKNSDAARDGDRNVRMAIAVYVS